MDDLWRGWLLDQPRSGKQELLVRRLGASTSSHGFTRLRRRNLSSDELPPVVPAVPAFRSVAKTQPDSIWAALTISIRTITSCSPQAALCKTHPRPTPSHITSHCNGCFNSTKRRERACAAAIATDVGRQSAACRIASVGDSSAVEPASTNLFNSRGNALCQRRTRRGTW